MKQVIFLLALALVFGFFIPAQAATRDEQRMEIQKMRSTVLNKLYKAEPEAEEKIAQAAGYAVFSSADLAAIFVSGSYGHGLAHNNNNGSETYMQMASLGAGLGLGVKDFRAVFVFDNQKVFDDFVTTGLDLSGHVDIAAKGGGAGGAVSGAQDVLPGVRVYQLTESGLLAQVMLKGTKYWRDDDLNDYDRSSDAGRTFNYNQ
jgi:lipid-binding SYLF domain-containing protein